MTADEVIIELKKILLKNYHSMNQDFMNGSLEFATNPTEDLRKFIKKYEKERNS